MYAELLLSFAVAGMQSIHIISHQQIEIGERE